MPFDKIYGVELPRPLLKNMGSVIRDNSLEYRTKQVNIFARRNV